MTTAPSSPPTGQIPVAGQLPITGQVAISQDPARRPDVLLRRRMPPGHQISAWWMIGAFLATSLAAIGLLTFFPG